MDIQKQIAYWTKSSREDLAAAKSLLEKGHLRHALFFGHLAVEKEIKARVTRRIGEVPPKTHNLIRLAEIAGLALTETQWEFLREFNLYQMEGRYPDAGMPAISKCAAAAELRRAEEFLEWLTAQSKIP